MKRLFGIKKPNGNWHKIVSADKNRNPIPELSIVFFSEKKKDAKAVRDALNAKLPEGAVGVYTVSYGPDHNKFKN